MSNPRLETIHVTPNGESVVSMRDVNDDGILDKITSTPVIIADIKYGEYGNDVELAKEIFEISNLTIGGKLTLWQVQFGKGNNEYIESVRPPNEDILEFKINTNPFITYRASDNVALNVGTRLYEVSMSDGCLINGFYDYFYTGVSKTIPDATNSFRKGLFVCTSDDGNSGCSAHAQDVNDTNSKGLCDFSTRPVKR